MTPLGKSRHLAARMGRWSASHWKTATFGWLAFVVAAFAIGNVIGTKNLDPNKAGSGESGHVRRVLADEFKQPANENVIIQSPARTVDYPSSGTPSPRDRRAQGQRHVRDMRSPFAPATPARSRGSACGARAVQDAGHRPDRLRQAVVPVEAAVAPSRRRIPRVAIGQAGDASVGRGAEQADRQGLREGGPLLAADHPRHARLAFGAFVAAGLPAPAGAHAVAGDDGPARDTEPPDPVDQNVSVIVLLIGLAVGVDYSMFYLKREREERPREAATAQRSRPRRRPPDGRCSSPA